MRFLASAMLAIAALFFVASSGPSLAVVGTPPTAVCNGKCEACLEVEKTPQGDRCLKCGIDAACMQGGDPGLSSDFTQMLKDHNAYRAQQCAGKLTWSGDLARTAQAYASTCPWNAAHNGFNHDANRGQVGENLFWGQGTSAPQAVKWWFDEIRFYDFKNPVWSSEVGHFTQVVWKDSKELGCGVANCGGTLLWVCRYSPPGNWNVKNPGVMASQVGCGAKGVATGGGGTGGGGGTTNLPTKTVVQAVDVWEKQGGKGRKFGFVQVDAKVQLTGACVQNWCPIKGSAVPTGKGWVYNGPDYKSLK